MIECAIEGITFESYFVSKSAENEKLYTISLIVVSKLLSEFFEAVLFPLLCT